MSTDMPSGVRWRTCHLSPAPGTNPIRVPGWIQDSATEQDGSVIDAPSLVCGQIPRAQVLPAPVATLLYMTSRYSRYPLISTAARDWPSGDNAMACICQSLGTGVG